MGGVSLAGVREAFPCTFPVPLGFVSGKCGVFYRHGSSRSKTRLCLAHMKLNLRHTQKGSECKSRALMYMTLRKQMRRNYITGSFIPAPSLPRPSPRFQPIFSSIRLPLFSSPISLYTHSEKKHKSAKTSLTLILLRN